VAETLEPASVVHAPDGVAGRGMPSLPSITVEHLLWALLIVTAIVTRFWDLGYRALHHDESLHAYYSWRFSTGEIPYQHNPLMHGPFLFHANALIYQLFGVSDATSRYLPAAFGVALVWLPWFLRGRRFLGPWGALAAGYMLLLSPAFLYYTRYIRHDPYTAVGSLLLAIAIFRYLERPQRRWIIVAFATAAFLLTNHEIVFAIALGFVMVLWGSLLWTRLRPLIPVHLAGGAAALGVLALTRIGDVEPLPAIPWSNATAEATRAYYGHLLTHPLVLGLLAVGVLSVVACVLVMRRHVASRVDERGYLEAIFGGAAPNTVAHGVYHALRDPIGLGAGFVAAVAIFLGLFTTLFTNMRGIATATYAPDGTLLYWLGQQGVQRGEQPWFYFITEGFQYEWLAIFFGVSATILVGVRMLRGLFGRGSGPNLLFTVFLAVWFIFLFAVLSWAGEKMPWLILHFTLPAILVGASLINEIVDGALTWMRVRRDDRSAWSRSRIGMRGLFVGLLGLAGSWYLIAAHFTYGQWVQLSGTAWERQIPRWALDDWWMLAIPPLLALALIMAAAWLIGPRRTAYATLTAVFVVFSLFQVHQGFRLAYLDGDIARDTLIYNTTAPDVTQLTHDLGVMSEIAYGDRSMSIMYDGCSQWPLNWYLRDFPNRQMSSTISDDPATMAPVIIGVPAAWDGSRSCTLPDEIDGYTSQTYVLRWHEPEQSIYREFAIAPEIPVGRSAWLTAGQPHGVVDIARSVLDSFQTLTHPEGQQRLFRLLMYRELPQGLNPYRIKVYVRNDMLPYYNEVRYGE
jgi:predicted membrane-bound mannosyltransferase